MATQCRPVLNGVVIEMPDGDLRSNACMIRPVEFEERVRWPIVSLFAIRIQNSFADLRRPEPFTFEREKRKLGGSIENSQTAIEFQAIDDHRLRFQTDVFGT